MFDLAKQIEVDVLWSKLDIGGTDSATLQAAQSGGTAAAQHWVSVASAQTVTFCVQRDATTGNNSDDPTTLIVQQATDSSGSGVKAVATYTYTKLELTKGMVHYVTVQAKDLDVAGGFDYVRVKLSMTDDAAVEFTHCVAIKYNLRFPNDTDLVPDRSSYT
jgi:hypothetical protein